MIRSDSRLRPVAMIVSALRSIRYEPKPSESAATITSATRPMIEYVRLSPWERRLRMKRAAIGCRRPTSAAITSSVARLRPSSRWALGRSRRHQEGLAQVGEFDLRDRLRVLLLLGLEEVLDGGSPGIRGAGAHGNGDLGVARAGPGPRGRRSGRPRRSAAEAVGETAPPRAGRARRAGRWTTPGRPRRARAAATCPPPGRRTGAAAGNRRSRRDRPPKAAWRLPAELDQGLARALQDALGGLTQRPAQILQRGAAVERRPKGLRRLVEVGDEREGAGALIAGPSERG